MLAAAGSRLRTAISPSSSSSHSSLLCPRPWNTLFSYLRSTASLPASKPALLALEEVEEILRDVKADDVKVIPVRGTSQLTDFMVIATGRSAWHVRNIADALIYKVKEKQRGSDQILLPSVEGFEGGKWVVVDSGTVIVHALDLKARAYYNLESLWTKEKIFKQPEQEIELIS